MNVRCSNAADPATGVRLQRVFFGEIAVDDLLS
jgi:hypothetical protein